MKKMLLIDPNVLEKLKARQLPVLQSINDGMKRTLDDSTLPATDRVQLYNQQLSRLTTMDENNTTPPQTHTSQSVSNDERIEREILASVPKSMKRRTERLLEAIREGSAVKWNQRGEVIIHGQLHSNTHILDLVNDTLRLRKNFTPRGWQPFAEALRDMGIPEDLMRNTRHREHVYGSTEKKLTHVHKKPKLAKQTPEGQSSADSSDRETEIFWESFSEL